LGCFQIRTTAAWRKFTHRRTTKASITPRYTSGDHGQQLRWVEFNSAEDSVGPVDALTGILTLKGGPYGPSSYIADYGRAIRTEVWHGTVYMQTNVYHPQGGEPLMLLGMPHPASVFVNREKIYTRNLRPLTSIPSTDLPCAFPSSSRVDGTA